MFSTSWTQWLVSHPDQWETAQRAREVLLASQVIEKPVSQEQLTLLVERTVQAVRQSDAPVVPLARRHLGWYAAAAASVVLLLSLGWYAFQRRMTGGQLPMANLTARTQPPLIEKRNLTRHPVPVSLPDGSTVLLLPNS